MKSVKDYSKNEIIIEKSRFITYIFHVEKIDEVKEIIDRLKKEYNDATHIVYGFIVENQERSNDNGEPKGTAGIPTIEVLRKEKLSDCLAVTIRYFGGIKLGASGLVRAYTKGVTECLKVSTFITKCDFKEIELNVSYKDSAYLDKNLSLAKDVIKKYSDIVSYNIKIKDDDLINFKDIFINFKDDYEFKIISSWSMYL